MQIESDFSAFHRVDDVTTLPAARFVQWTELLFAYKGAMRFEAEQESEKKSNRHQAPKPTTTTRNWKKSPKSTTAPSTSSSPSNHFKDAALNPALTCVQPGERMPFLEKGDPTK